MFHITELAKIPVLEFTYHPSGPSVLLVPKMVLINLGKRLRGAGTREPRAGWSGRFPHMLDEMTWPFAPPDPRLLPLTEPS